MPPDSGSQVPRRSITPADNPFPTSASLNARLVWAYGMRNPWRFDVDSLTGAVYVGDVGEADFEEMDEVYPGDFLGWPYREGFKVMSPVGCTEPGGTGANNYKGPILAMPHGAGATALCCAGMYRPSATGTSNWPVQYWGIYGDLFYAEYFSGVLRRLKRQAGQWVTPLPVPGQPDSQNWATGLSGAVDFHVGTDGSLWWLSQFDATFTGATGSLQRIRYQPVQAAAGPAAATNAALEPAPNPFTVDVRLSFRLERAESVRLEMFDLSGRRVRTLLRGTAAAGETHVDWSGDDNAGRPVPPGVYIARLARGEHSTVVRVLRVK
jgi:hypothetical protein